MNKKPRKKITRQRATQERFAIACDPEVRHLLDDLSKKFQVAYATTTYGGLVLQAVRELHRRACEENLKTE